MDYVTTLLAMAAFCLSGATLAVVWKIWQKLRDVHVRLHASDQHRQVLEQNLGAISRATSRAVAAHVTQRPIVDIRSSAQHGEELFVWECLNFQPDGVFIEIGAYDGMSLSNSLFFESIGWRTILIEAHPELAERCRQSRPEADVVHAALGEVDGGSIEFSMVTGVTGMDTLSFVGGTAEHEQRITSRGGRIEQVQVPARTLASILKERDIQNVDCMSIDVEGAELAVLKAAGLDLVKPRVIIVEDNSGGADDAVPALLKSLGYVQSGTVGCNVIFTQAA